MAGSRSRREYVLLYDEECRICRAIAQAVQGLDVRKRLRIQPIQRSAQLLRGCEVDPLDAMHVVAPGGHVTSGGDALPTLLEGLSSAPTLGSLLRASRTSKAALNAFYSVLVELRGHLICRVVSERPSPPVTDSR